MTDKIEYNRKQVVKYLIWTFALAYAIQFAAAYKWNNVDASIGALIVAAMMFVPTLGVLLAGGKLKGMGWNPRIRKNIGSFLIAWFMPIVFTALGAALYFSCSRATLISAEPRSPPAPVRTCSRSWRRRGSHSACIC